MVAVPAVAAGRDVALIIGNSNYQSTARFSKAVSDARAIAGKFRGIGFDDVALELNLSHVALLHALEAFAGKSRRADRAVIYFAGLGLNFAGQNYLLPVDAQIRDAAYGILDQAVEFEALLTAVGGARDVKLIILDVCRDGLLARLQAEALDLNKTRRSAACFLPLEPPEDIVIASAARHGTVAVDGDKALSPFARAILEHIGTPDLDIGQVFARVHDTVRFWTNQRQHTVLYGAATASSKEIIPRGRH
jgi:uncharacterized caspase-like protein